MSKIVRFITFGAFIILLGAETFGSNASHPSPASLSVDIITNQLKYTEQRILLIASGNNAATLQSLIDANNVLIRMYEHSGDADAAYPCDLKTINRYLQAFSTNELPDHISAATDHAVMAELIAANELRIIEAERAFLLSLREEFFHTAVKHKRAKALQVLVQPGVVTLSPLILH